MLTMPEVMMMDEDDFLLEEITGKRKKTTVRTVLNKKKLDRFEVDQIFNDFR